MQCYALLYDANYVNVMLRLGSRLQFGLLEWMLQCLACNAMLRFDDHLWQIGVPKLMLCFISTAVFSSYASLWRS